MPLSKCPRETKIVCVWVGLHQYISPLNEKSKGKVGEIINLHFKPEIQNKSGSGKKETPKPPNKTRPAYCRSPKPRARLGVHVLTAKGDFAASWEVASEWQRFMQSTQKPPKTYTGKIWKRLLRL